MTDARYWPHLQHVGSQRMIPLRLNGHTTFGRSEDFYDYEANMSLRWSKELATDLRKSDYIWISENTCMSRTHGRVLHIQESDTLIYQDLNSTNGSQINFVGLEKTEGTIHLAKSLNQAPDLPVTVLKAGDVVTLGGVESFNVRMVPNPKMILADTRAAVLIDGCGMNTADSFGTTLSLLEQKTFNKDRILTVDCEAPSIRRAYQKAMSKLATKLAEACGFQVIYIKGQVEGDKLLLNDKKIETAASLLSWVDQIPGAKVLILQSENSAEAFSNCLEERGFQDTLLVTYQGFNLTASQNPATASGAQSGKTAEPALAPQGTFRVSGNDDPNDVLNALIHPDEPNLRTDELQPYVNRDIARLRLTIGEQLRPIESYRGVLQSLDFELGSSLAHSFRSSQKS